MTDKEKLSIMGLVGIFIIAAALIISLSTEESAVEPVVSKENSLLMAATISHYSLPEGTIIHKDLGKGWKCVEIAGNLLLIRDVYGSSVAVSVDSCKTDGGE